jgi:hypothetical protein
MPKTGFFMFSTRENIRGLRNTINQTFEAAGFHLVDAMARMGGDDNYCKICELIQSTAFGVALITENTPPESRENIYLEIGLVRAFGKESLILTPDRMIIASDLEGKGVFPFNNKKQLIKGINNWISQIPRRIKFFNRFSEIYLKQADYEKFFDYSKKAIMFGDYGQPLRRLNEVFVTNLDPENQISKRLILEVQSFIALISP